MSIDYNNLSKLKDLLDVIFRETKSVEDAYELVDSDTFTTALSAAMQSWDWASHDGTQVLNELREARKLLENDSDLYLVLIDTVIDHIKERQCREQNQPTDTGTTQDG